MFFARCYAALFALILPLLATSPAQAAQYFELGAVLSCSSLEPRNASQALPKGALIGQFELLRGRTVRKAADEAGAAAFVRGDTGFDLKGSFHGNLIFLSDGGDSITQWVDAPKIMKGSVASKSGLMKSFAYSSQTKNGTLLALTGGKKFTLKLKRVSGVEAREGNFITQLKVMIPRKRPEILSFGCELRRQASCYDKTTGVKAACGKLMAIRTE